MELLGAYFGTLAGLALAVLAVIGVKLLTANANVDRFVDQEMRSFPVAAAAHIFKGALVGLNPGNYLKPFVPGDRFAGLAYEEIDNSSGANAALSCRVYTTGDITFTLTSVAQTDVGKPVYGTADDAIALTGHPDGYVGRILAVYTTNTAVVRLRTWGELPPNDGSSVNIAVDFGRLSFAALDEATVTSVTLGGLLKTACIGAGLTAGTSGLLMDEANGEARMLIDNDNEAENLTFETPQVFNITKGATFEMVGRLKTAGTAATDDLDFGVAGLAGGLTATERADMNAATAGLIAALFHLNADANDVFFSSDDNATVVAATDTTFNNSLTVNHRFTIIVRPPGTTHATKAVCEVWIDGVWYLTTTEFSLGATGMICGVVNLEKSTGTAVPEVRVRTLRMAGATA